MHHHERRRADEFNRKIAVAHGVETVRGLCRQTAKVLTGQYGLDPGKIAELDPREWYNRVGSIDMNAHIQEALDSLKHNYQK